MRVADALNTLGLSAEVIRIQMREQGITGTVLQSNSCPLSNYLSGLTDELIEVTELFIFEGGAIVTETPHHIREFIETFDAEYYPELIDEGNRYELG